MHRKGDDRVLLWVAHQQSEPVFSKSILASKIDRNSVIDGFNYGVFDGCPILEFRIILKLHIEQGKPECLYFLVFLFVARSERARCRPVFRFGVEEHVEFRNQPAE